VGGQQATILAESTRRHCRNTIVVLLENIYNNIRLLCNEFDQFQRRWFNL